MRAVSMLLVAGLMVGCSPAPAPAAPLVNFTELLARPHGKASERVAYGPGPQQFADLWLPQGEGPFPVVALIHGGCWMADLPGVELMDQMATDLRGRGYAVWNVEYRRLGHDGGGYPGTYTDVGQAMDKLGQVAASRGLDLNRVVVSGHSAGGHLAAWVVSRGRIAKSSPLWVEHPLTVRGAVVLAGITDLAAYRASGPNCGRADTIDRISGAKDRPGQDVFADTSPAAMAPTGVEQVVISGALDPIVPPRFGEPYAEHLRAVGDKAETVTIKDAGHFEVIDPKSAAWPPILAAIERLAK
jgi:acetyl esterase/lipase